MSWLARNAYCNALVCQYVTLPYCSFMNLPPVTRRSTYIWETWSSVHRHHRAEDSNTQTYEKTWVQPQNCNVKILLSSVVQLLDLSKELSENEDNVTDRHFIVKIPKCFIFWTNNCNRRSDSNTTEFKRENIPVW